jgi:hypothetical protein
VFQHHNVQNPSRRGLLKMAGAAGLGTAAALGASKQATAAGSAFAHPGLLHIEADLDRMAAKVKAKAQPYYAGWQRLTGNSHSQPTWKANPQPIVYRGADHPENYATLYHDIHAAYQNALRWRITGERAHGDAARDILNAWSGTLTKVDGSADRFIAAGIYGYQFANAAELMRDYPGFELAKFKTMMLRVFYPLCDSFLRDHNGAYPTNYYASWDLLTLCAVLSIGVLCDDRTKVDQAVDYFKHGKGNGSIRHAIPYVHADGLAQFQESGRDQGHTTLSVGLMGAFCEMAWNQGLDLYGYDDNRFLKGAEYVAKYNLGQDVPFTSFDVQQGAPGVWSGTQHFTKPSEDSRGSLRPIWVMIENHYVNRRGLSAPYTTAMAAKVAPEGGGGDYGPNSGGFDQLGFGTLAFTRPKTTTPASTPRPAPTQAAASTAPAAGPDASTPSSTAKGFHEQASGAPSPSGRGDLAITGSSGLVPLTGAGLLALGGGILALRLRDRRRGAQRS